jgi:signal transduction histidine kinase/DNA-binding NarL/FixJ family response regulator
MGQEAFGMPSELTRRTRGLPSWLWPDTVIAHFPLLAAASMIVGAVLVVRSSADWTPDVTSRLAAAAAQDIAGNLEQLDRSLQSLISRHQSPELQGQDTRVRVAPLFERIQREPYFAFIDVLDEKGNAVAGLPQNNNNWSERDYFRALQNAHSDRMSVGGRFSVESEKNVGITVSRRMTDAGGSFAGVVVMGVRLTYFRELLQHLELGTGDSAMLLRDDGNVLMRLPFDMNSVGDALESTAPLYAAMKAGASSVTAADPIDHVERMFALHRVGAFPLYVAVGAANQGIAGNPILWWLGVPGGGMFASFILLSRARAKETRRRQAAEQESREKSRFLATLSHKLRTPLHGILGYAEQLSREGSLGETQQQQVFEIMRAGRHMRDAVNVVLDYARIEALGPALHMSRIDVRAVAEDCVAVIAPSARARGLETRITMTVGAPAHFVTDDIQLRHILMNLLSNAVKYTPQGAIEVRLMGDEEHLVIEIADTGIGIPECKRHLLFQEFERFGTERTSIEGTGLGLAIAHRLTRRMGGHLGHRDNPGGGSVFWLELPAGAEESEDPEVAPEAATPDLSRLLSVLVVDDSDVNRKLAATYLRNVGHSVVEAAGGSEAVRLVATQDFDVVLMDVRMPDIDGLEATRRIRALDEPHRRVPIIAVTANALDGHAEECRRAGMSEHLAKPFTQAELIAVIARAASGWRRASSAPAPVIDPECLTQVAAVMGDEAVDRLLDGLALRIESLLRTIEDPTAVAASDRLTELAHELKGSGGTLGFARLAAAAGHLERAPATGTADVGEIRREAMAALAELRRRRSLESLLSV